MSFDLLYDLLAILGVFSQSKQGKGDEMACGIYACEVEAN